jgi:hypothetical protein
MRSNAALGNITWRYITWRHLAPPGAGLPNRFT